MPELTELVNFTRKKDYDEKKFLAAIQGIDLDKETGGKSSSAPKGSEDIKAQMLKRAAERKAKETKTTKADTEHIPVDALQVKQPDVEAQKEEYHGMEVYQSRRLKNLGFKVKNA